MRFVLYTEKTVAQCLSAINERMQVKGTKTRPAMDGWVEKNGEFSVAVSSPVAGRFMRKTHLQAQMKREGGITTIQGYVPDGVNRQGLLLILGALLLVGVILLTRGNALLAILTVLVGAALYVPLVGDHRNSAILLKELRSTLHARETPPKKSPSVRRGVSRPR